MSRPRSRRGEESRVELVRGDVTEVLSRRPEASFDGALCDPPYGLGMAEWDAAVPARQAWAALARVLVPGGWVLAFGSPRTHHRLAAAIEAGGLEVRDVVLWLFATGMPAGRTSLKPAWQPVVLARRPGAVRPLDVDGCRTGVVLPRDRRTSARGSKTAWGARGAVRTGERHDPRGRWPANLMLGHGPGCLPELCRPGCSVDLLGGPEGEARFFWCAPPRGAEIEANDHPAKKPVRLTKELAKLLRGGSAARRLAVPWCGSGSEVVGALRAGWREVAGIEREARWIEVARRRVLGEGVSVRVGA